MHGHVEAHEGAALRGHAVQTLLHSARVDVLEALDVSLWGRVRVWVNGYALGFSVRVRVDGYAFGLGFALCFRVRVRVYAFGLGLRFELE